MSLQSKSLQYLMVCKRAGLSLSVLVLSVKMAFNISQYECSKNFLFYITVVWLWRASFMGGGASSGLGGLLQGLKVRLL